MAYSDEVMIAVLERVEKHTKNNVASTQVPIPLSTDDERDCFDCADHKQFIFGGSRRASSLSPAGKEQLYLLRLRQEEYKRASRRFRWERRRVSWEAERAAQGRELLEQERERINQERQRFAWEAKRFALEIERHSREKIKHGLDIIAIILAIISLLVSIITVGLLAYVPST